MLGPAPAAFAGSPEHVPGEVVVKYKRGAASAARLDLRGARLRGAEVAFPSGALGPRTRVLELQSGNVARVAAELERDPDVAWARPNYIARAGASRGYFPDDPGKAQVAGGWRRLQWNFLARTGIGAPDAWRNLMNAGRDGASGVRIAVLDSGIAYRRRGKRFRMARDFVKPQFARGYDFVDDDRLPLDRFGHGTFVASIIAAQVNNDIFLTGLAYGATIIPVRVLDDEGAGKATDIAAGIRYATDNGADVINLSFQFSEHIGQDDIPEVDAAIRRAFRKGVVIVAAAGNYGTGRVSHPARHPKAIAVGATTRRGCLADYSQYGADLDLVAPGGGLDATGTGESSCSPGSRDSSGIWQQTFAAEDDFRRFALRQEEGTSFATPHVSAAAAMVIAARSAGRNPTPDDVRERLESTARDLGEPGRDTYYGHGLVDAAAATSRR